MMTLKLVSNRWRYRTDYERYAIMIAWCRATDVLDAHLIVLEERYDDWLLLTPLINDKWCSIKEIERQRFSWKDTTAHASLNLYRWVAITPFLAEVQPKSCPRLVWAYTNAMALLERRKWNIMSPHGGLSMIILLDYLLSILSFHFAILTI